MHWVCSYGFLIIDSVESRSALDLEARRNLRIVESGGTRYIQRPDGIAFDGIAFDGIAFDGIAFDGIAFVV